MKLNLNTKLKDLPINKRIQNSLLYHINNCFIRESGIWFERTRENTLMPKLKDLVNISYNKKQQQLFYNVEKINSNEFFEEKMTNIGKVSINALLPYITLAKILKLKEERI